MRIYAFHLHDSINKTYTTLHLKHLSDSNIIYTFVSIQIILSLILRYHIMSKQTLLKLYTLLSFIFLCQISFANDKKNETVLVINSYTEGYAWTNYAYTGILDYLANTGGRIKVKMESLTMQLLNDLEDVEIRKERIMRPYIDNPPKAIVLLGNSAFILFREELENSWRDIPVVLCSDNDYVGDIEAAISKGDLDPSKEKPLEEAARGMNLTIIKCPIYPKRTIEVMRKLLPDMKKLALISDCRYMSAQVRHEVKEVVEQNFPNLQISYLTYKPLNLDQVLDSLQSYDQTTGILFYSWIQEQTQLGNRYMQANNHKIMLSLTTDPIFTLMDVDVNTGGMAGGYFYKGTDMGETLAAQLAKVLNGQKPADIPWVEAGQPSLTLCYNVLQMGNIDKSLYPSDAVYLFSPPSFWQSYHDEIIILSVLILAAIAFTVFYSRRETKHRKREMLMLKKYKTLFNNMPITYCKYRLLKDEQGNVTDYVIEEANALYANSATGKRFPVGTHGSETTPNIKDYVEMYQEVLRCQKNYSYEYHHETYDSHYELKVSPAAEPDTVDIYIIDITQLHKTQALVESINHKLAMALEVANIVPWKWNLEKHTILCDVNRPIEIQDSTKNTDEDTLAVPESEYFSKIHKEDRRRVEQAYAMLISGKVDKIREEYRVLHRAGNHADFEWVEAQATVDARNSDGTPQTLVGSSVVITKRKEMELELITAKDRAEESNRLKSAFLANMSHEIRTPLNAIVGFSNILSCTEEFEEKQEYAAIIENNNTLLLQLINDILDISKIEAGTLEFTYTNFSLNDTMRELEQMFKLRIANKPIEMKCEMSLPYCHIHSEKNRLTQVLSNLLTNAVKFTSQGEICLGYREQEDGMLYFYVTDTGCGIPKEQKEAVFGRFVKLNDFQQGTGLGLSICETIIRKMGGRIGVDSEEGHGSTFWFTIPFIPVSVTPSKKQEMLASSPAEIEIVNRDKLKILIAEDNESNYRLFETILKKDYQLIHAANGHEAVESFRQHAPHLILMDINMPVLNGYGAVEEIRKLSATVPIIAVTAYAFEEDEQRILHSGFNGYTSKPINANALKSKIISLLEKRLILI